MKNIFQKLINIITERYNSLNGVAKIITIAIGVFFLAVICNSLSKFKIEYTIIDYNNYSVEELISSSTLSNDRLVFLKIEEVVNDILEIEKGQYKVENKTAKLSDLYKFGIFNEYKYTISGNDFNKIVKAISKSFNSKYGVETPKELAESSIVGEVYMYSEPYGMYIAKLNLDDSEHYIGIKFSLDNSYKIFYIS